MWGTSRTAVVILTLAAGVLASSTASAEHDQGLTATPLSPASVTHGKAPKPPAAYVSGPGGGERMVSAIVKLEYAPLASYEGGVAGLYGTSPGDGPRLDVRSHESRAYLAYLTEQQDAFEESTSKAVSGARITHRYQVVLV